MRFDVTQVMNAIERHLTTEAALAQAVVDLGQVAWFDALDGGRSVSLLRAGLLVDALSRHLGEDAVMLYPVASRDLLTDADLTSKERMVLGRWSGDGLIEGVAVMADRVAEVAEHTGLPVVTIDGFPGLEHRYPWLRGQPERMHLISRTNGYHGTHGFGTSVGGIEANVSNWGPLVPQVSAVAHDSLPALEAEILRVGPERVAAFFCEPVLGAGGVHPPAEGYIDGVADLCAEHGILLVIDSVICAFGRLGTWFGVERWPDVRPDLITFAKGVTSGYLPLGGVLVSGAVAAPFFERPGGPMLRHGATYAGHPTVCAAALAVLDIYEGEGIIERGRMLEGPLTEVLAPLTEHPAVAGVRSGTGLLGAVALTEDALAADPAAVNKLAAGAREAGVLVRPLLGAVAVSPPLVVEREHLEELAAGIRAGLDRLDGAPPVPEARSGL